MNLTIVPSPHLHNRSERPVRTSCALLAPVLVSVAGVAQVNTGSDGHDGSLNPTSNRVVNMAGHPDGIQPFMLWHDQFKTGVVEIDFNLANSEGVNIYSRRDGDGEFKFLARDTVPPCVDNRPMLVAGKPELCPDPTVPADARQRPLLIVCPRAGQGPGIGGFKPDSEVGMALRAGHPVHFATFFPRACRGGTDAVGYVA